MGRGDNPGVGARCAVWVAKCLVKLCLRMNTLEQTGQLKDLGLR